MQIKSKCQEKEIIGIELLIKALFLKKDHNDPNYDELLILATNLALILFSRT